MKIYLILICLIFNTANADILEIQNFTEETSNDKIALLNLNKNTNSWYLVTLKDSGKKFHIQNTDPEHLRLSLHTDGMLLIHNIQNKSELKCDLFLRLQNIDSSTPYGFQCNGAVLVRNKVSNSYKSSLEKNVERIRNVPGGESVINWVKWGKGLISSPEVDEESKGAHSKLTKNAPVPAFVKDSNLGISTSSIGIKTNASSIAVGSWLSAVSPGLEETVYVSVIRPSDIDYSKISDPVFDKRVNKLSSDEQANSTYLMAFDLSKISVGYSLGVDHPAMGWSARLTPEHNSWINSSKSKNPKGPEGFSSTAPIQRLGMVPPQYLMRTLGVFVGGFKLEHSAFRYGPFSDETKNGNHYGIIQDGVVFSPLKSGLITGVMYVDGNFDLKVWNDEDNAQLENILHARQNGVPLIEWNSELKKGVPGEFVNNWGSGNWSGALVVKDGKNTGKIETIRSGVCLQEKDGKRFLIFGYFSYSTPSSMARVFQAYQCKTAMLLDMNSREMAYGAVYSRNQDKLTVEHIHKDLSSIDPSPNDPRFLTTNDTRDFFYILKKSEK